MLKSPRKPGTVDYLHGIMARLALSVLVDHRFMEVAVRAVQNHPAGDIELGEKVLHVADDVGQLRGSYRTSAVPQRVPVPGVGAFGQQH
ncbi:hypothetical protein D3C73_1525400 [compost metagenome]